MPACALYLRVSTDDQTVENQRAEVARLATARGFDTLTVYEEIGSAVKARPVFERMLSDVRAGHVQAVAVWSLDRLGRGFQCFDTYRELARLNVRVLSARESWIDAEGPTRDLLVAVMSWVAGFERTRLIERINAGLAQARRNGTRSGKPIGRPRTSPVLLAAAAELVSAGTAVASAARRKGVSRRALQRYLCETPTRRAGGNPESERTPRHGSEGRA